MLLELRDELLVLLARLLMIWGTFLINNLIQVTDEIVTLLVPLLLGHAGRIMLAGTAEPVVGRVVLVEVEDGCRVLIAFR